MTGDSAPCELLRWDTEFWGFPVARVTATRPSASTLSRVDEWCADHAVRCVFMLENTVDHEVRRLAISNGFIPVDERVDLVATAVGSGVGDAVTVRQHVESDAAALLELASTAHDNTRFFRDPHFPRVRCQELYRVWIDRSCRGWADFVLVAEVEGRPAGYVTGHVGPERCQGRIGLLGVRAPARGKGVGKALLAASMREFETRTALPVTVTTQGSNTRAIALYVGAGFVAQSSRTWFHKWFEAR